MITHKSKPYKPDWITRLLREIGIVVSGQASLLPLKDTGRLRGSITYSVDGQVSRTKTPATNDDAVPRNTDKHSVIIGTNVEYAAYQEYGTHRMRGKPYLRPAVDATKREVRRLVRDTFRRSAFG